nr:MAG TPA: hypothetical protein [Caudoviricetes sp.]
MLMLSVLLKSYQFKKSKKEVRKFIKKRKLRL